MIIFILIVLIILYLTYSEVKKIQEHSHKQHKNDTHIEKKSIKPPLFIGGGVILFAGIIYFGYVLINNSDFEFKKNQNQKSISKKNDSKKNKNSKKDNNKKNSNFFSKTNDTNKNGEDLENNNNDEEIQKTIAYEFFKKYENIFGVFISESGRKIITDKNEFEVNIKNKKVASVKIIYPFEKQIYNRQSVNMEAAKRTVKKYKKFNIYISPLDSSVELLNKEIEKTLFSSTFEYIKTDLLEEKNDYFILKVTYNEIKSDGKKTKKNKIARLYTDGKVKIIN